MVAIAPFRALRYHHDELAQVTCPPHDVLADGEREELLERHPHNIARVVAAPPSGEEDPYAARARLLQQWIDEGVLVRDERPALYGYEILHGPPERRKGMRGFFCRIRLDPEYDAIRRHERTLKRKRSHSRSLLGATRCNTEPIWMLYRDERGWVDEVLWSNAMQELARFTDEAGFEHRLWRIDRDEAVGEVVAQFDDRDVVIADGHHRYRSALKHYEQTGREEDASIMVCMVRDTDAGLRIQATDRLVTDCDVDGLDAALEAVSEHWDVVDRIPAAQAGPWAQALRDAVGEDGRSVAVVGRGADGDAAAAVLRLRDGALVDRGRGTLDRLAVTQVHERLLPAWGVDAHEPEDHLTYTRDDEEAVQAVLDGSARFAVLLAPEPVHAVLDVATEGHLMPQKSTFFVPKLRSGVVLGPLDEPMPRDWQEEAGDGGGMEFRMPPL